MILFVNGCSHSFGEKDDNIFPYSDLFKSSTFSNVINNAKQGKSNDSIFADTIYRLSLIKDLTKLYCVIQFSAPNRRAHMLPDGERIYVNPYDNTNYHMKLEPLASNDTLCYMFALQNIFKNYFILLRTVFKNKFMISQLYIIYYLYIVCIFY